MQRSLRVLCTSTGGAGHVYALAPVARALRDRGHDVRWAVAADGGAAVGAMGFEWSAAGLTTSARREAAAAALGGLMKLPMEERRGPGDDRTEGTIVRFSPSCCSASRDRSWRKVASIA